MTKQELEVCIQAYGRDIYSFCRQLAGGRQEADELYQDTFLTAVERLESINYESNPKSYLLSIAIRLWQNRKRKFAWRRRIADIQPMDEEKSGDRAEGEETTPEEKVLGRERDAMIRQAVDRLPERLRIVTLLYYMEELSTVQIAAVLMIPKGTVSSRLHQARELLRQELEDFNGK